MADGARATVNKRERIWISGEDWTQIEIAVRRIARAFGYGDGWRSPTFDVGELPYGGYSAGDDDRRPSSDGLAIARRGGVVEQAAGSIRGSTRVTRRRCWSIHRGILSVPHSNPDPMAQAALSFAKLPMPIESVLIAYALGNYATWQMAERFAQLVAKDVSVEAIRHAMARLMGRTISVDARAKQLHTRAQDYGAQVRTAERLLSGWLIRAARAYNLCADAMPTTHGRSEPSGFRRSTFWNPEKARRSSSRSLGGGCNSAILMKLDAGCAAQEL